jgi:predicted nucleic acid-binding protein
MLAVSDTSPLRYLIVVRHADLLHKLFGTVLIPRAVERELTDPHAPSPVQGWMARRPRWLETRDLQTALDLKLADKLGPGEAEAIQLAISIPADFLVIDERPGREIALARDLTVVGVFGILRESYRRGFIGDPLEISAELRLHGFRASRTLVVRFTAQIHDLERRAGNRAADSS